MEIDQLGRLRDILEAARLIGTYVKNTTETDFYADKQKQDAVIRRIEIINEWSDYSPTILNFASCVGLFP